jgi:hypothetical protein
MLFSVVMRLLTVLMWETIKHVLWNILLSRAVAAYDVLIFVCLQHFSICILLKGSCFWNDQIKLHDLLCEMCHTDDCFQVVHSCAYDSEKNRVKTFTILTPSTSLSVAELLDVVINSLFTAFFIKHNIDIDSELCQSTQIRMQWILVYRD